MRDWKHRSDHRTASGLQGLSGLALCATPWALGFAADTAALGAALVLGLAALAIAVRGVVAPREWQAWTFAGLGVLAALTPWLLDFAQTIAAAWSLVGFAVAVVVLAGVQIALALEADPDAKTA